ncbi:MAG: hypothetical protein K9N62_00070 [Verrucomicrobia bacterium]|jgi:hypothetical protein|nr:hypothetical protein [Verrucomicrobiota bacterium]
MKLSLPRTFTASLAVASLCFGSGCGSDPDDALGSVKPAAAAAELDQTFADADARTRKNVDAASEAMKRGEYEKAVVSLQTVRGTENLTLQQGMAVQRSVISMEAELISAMESGDQNARKAYQLLKQVNRN